MKGCYQEIHENDWHQEEEDEENDSDVDVERLEVVLEEDIVELDLTECHHDYVQYHRLELKHFLQQPIIYHQPFVKLTASIRLSASSKYICLRYVLMTDYLFLQTFVMHSWSGPREGRA